MSQKHDLSSLRLLGTVGEPINPEAWMWYHKVIGGGRCPIVDTWWQTETGGDHDRAPARRDPDQARLRHPSLARASSPEVVTKDGTACRQPTRADSWSSRKPWPAMLRTIFGDPSAGTRPQYWGQIPGSYFTGDGARCDEDGYYWIMGRVDDVLNVAGHRLRTMEIETALVSHPAVAEAAVVGRPDELKGQAIAAFVTLEAGHSPSEDLRHQLRYARGQGDRSTRSARRYPLHRRSAQDAQRQDHATPVAGHRSGS